MCLKLVLSFFFLKPPQPHRVMNGTQTFNKFIFFFVFFNFCIQGNKVVLGCADPVVDSSTAAWQRVGSSVCVGLGATEAPAGSGGWERGLGVPAQMRSIHFPASAYGGPLSSATEAEVMQFVGMPCHFTNRPSHWDPGQQKTSKGSLLFHATHTMRWSAHNTSHPTHVF